MVGNIDIGMINPPYSLDKKDSSSTQEYDIVKKINELKDKNKKIDKKIRDLKKKTPDTKDELDFVASMLHYLKTGGIGIAIIPMSCAGNSGTKLRKELLKYHTLLACMTMPSQLFFDSHVGANTCIMVFKAHIPHDNKKSTFFGRWKDDGFIVIPHNGRKNGGTWDKIRQEWIDQLDGTAKSNDTVFVRKKISNSDEALAEAYTKTDYSTLTKADFERTLKKYSLYKFMEENGLLED